MSDWNKELDNILDDRLPEPEFPVEIAERKALKQAISTLFIELVEKQWTRNTDISFPSGNKDELISRQALINNIKGED